MQNVLDKLILTRERYIVRASNRTPTALDDISRSSSVLSVLRNPCSHEHSAAGSSLEPHEFWPSFWTREWQDRGQTNALVVDYRDSSNRTNITPQTWGHRRSNTNWRKRTGRGSCNGPRASPASQPAFQAFRASRSPWSDLSATRRIQMTHSSSFIDPATRPGQKHAHPEGVNHQASGIATQLAVHHRKPWTGISWSVRLAVGQYPYRTVSLSTGVSTG